MARVQLWKRRVPADDDVPESGAADASPKPATGPPPAETPALSHDEPVDEPVGPAAGSPTGRSSRLRLSIADSTPVTLYRSAHPKQGLVTALGMGGAALLADRPVREAAVVALTVLVGQSILGWHNDLVDRARDADHGIAGKPLAEGRLDAGTAWFALTIGVLLVIPLSISTGVTAGTLYLLSLIIGVLGNVVLRSGKLSWVPWAASFALYPAYLSYGGWGGSAQGPPPEIAMTVLAALLGVGVHFLRAIWGLVSDDVDGWTYLPLTLGRRLGATRLLVLSTAYTSVVVAVIAVVGATVGLRQ